MLIPTRRRLKYENVPVDAAASFAVREFRWPLFPFNWHYHPEWELTLIAKGRGLRFVGDAMADFREGDLCLLGANVPHTWASGPRASRGVHSIVIQFAEQPLLVLPELRAVRQLGGVARRGLVVTGATRRLVTDHMRALVQQPIRSWRRLPLLITALGTLATSKELTPLASSAFEHIPNRQTDQKVATILRFIHDRVGGELTQPEVAAVAGLKPAAFSHFFRRTFGKAYEDFVNELKIHHACRDLLETDTPITTIAFTAGFNNLSHFNQQFRRLLGRSPREYRTAARQL